MLFMIAGYLKPGAEKRLIDFRNEFSEQLSQMPLVAAGALRDRDGSARAISASSRPTASRTPSASSQQGPFAREGLYERVEVFAIRSRWELSAPEGPSISEANAPAFVS